MKGYLLDENLPVRLRFSLSLPVIHATTLGRQATDSQVWEYARAHDLVIVTKDADFSHRVLVSHPPPRVVHLRFGNRSQNDFHEFLARIWPQIEALCTSHKLINVELEQITVIA